MQPVITTCNVSVNSNWVQLPGQPPEISSKSLPGGSVFDFRKLAGGREFDKGRDYVENEIETSKYSVDQIFTDENKKKTSRIFDLFRGLRVFFNRIFPGLWVNFLVLLSYLTKQSEELPLACLFEVFTALWFSTPTFCIKSYDYVKHFVRVFPMFY